MKLYQAAHIIQEIHQKDVIFIEFEDGSEKKFNFKLKNNEEVKGFIDLSFIDYNDVGKIKSVLESFKKFESELKKNNILNKI